MHINTFLREITRVRLLITGFSGRPIQRSHFWLQGSKKRCHGNQILAKIGQKNHKNGYNFNCKRHIHAELGFETGFVPSGYSSVTLPYTRDKGPLPWQPNLEQKLLNMHINAFLREITRVRLLITGFFVVDQSKEVTSDCKGLRGVAMATKFWPK